MTNLQYAKVMSDDPSIQIELLEVMESYGEDKWWISDNADYLAYKQFQEDTMLVESHAWQKATEKLIGREISFLELKLNYREIKSEVLTAYDEKYNH
ncbi:MULTISPECIES: hypothetical protein [unclassified Paenibacillus]|uniref:hypothetical protein n=1 Tax=unclassified Paenibacillus TaxID=185978 RepID=UPI00034ECAA3|nr:MULTISPECIES: hypothetical protein [unclassified Paenibacillus]EPD81302.1 hypothetical protein HMPREF1207_05059 [Paenibacillus sp. HGH0039]